MDHLIVHRHMDFPTLTIPANSKIGYLNAKAKHTLSNELPLYIFFEENVVKFKNTKHISDTNVFKASINNNTICCFGIPRTMIKTYRQVYKLSLRRLSVGWKANLIDISENYTITREVRN